MRSLISIKFQYDTTEKFSLRNTIFQMERKLKSEIQQRTGLLARAQQTELFNIREVLRAERKNLTKVSETAENTYRVTQQEIKQMRTEIARKNKETQDRMDKQSVQTHTLVREVDQRITMTKKATDQESVFDELSVRNGPSARQYRLGTLNPYDYRRKNNKKGHE